MTLPAIKKVYFEITNICNLNCSFCPGTQRKKGNVNIKDFITTLEKLRGKITYLYLHLMGEPTIHPQLPEFLDIANKLGFKVILTTNGTTLADKSEIILNYGSVYKVNISIHSFEANSSEKIQMDKYLNDCFEFATQAAQKNIICVFRLWNLDGERTMGQNKLNQGITNHMRQYFCKNDWMSTRNGFKLEDKIFLEFAQKFEWPDNKKICLGQNREEDFFCYGLRDQIGILCDGTVVPCCLDNNGNIPLGNIFESTYEEIMGSSTVKKFYDSVSARRCPSEFCNTCEYARRFSKKN